MFFNCWTLCHKSQFSDKKQNLCFHARITGAGVPDVHIMKTINVQQNPGRGAKVVCPKMRGASFQQQKVYSVDGSAGKSVVQLKTTLTLG